MIEAIKKIINWTGEKKSRIYWGMLFSTLESICVAVPYIITGISLNMLLLEGETLTTDHALYVFMAIVASTFARSFFSYIRSILQDSIIYEVACEERLALGGRLKRVPLGFFKKNNTGDISAALTTKLSFFEMFAMTMMGTVVNSYFFLFFTTLNLWFIHPYLAMISVIAMSLSSFGIKNITQKARKNAPPRQQALSRLADSSLEYIRGIAVVKSYHMEGVAAKDFHDTCIYARDVNTTLEKESILPQMFHRTAVYIGNCGIVGIICYLLLTGEMSISTWITLAIYSFVLFSGIESVDSSAVVLQILKTSLDEMEEISNSPLIDEEGTEIVPPHFEIKFQGVHFGYDSREILSGIDLTIPQNTTLAIVGASGSGKTTLCNLIARFYDVNQGKITLGDVDVREMTCNSLLANLTMVFQNVYIFHDTIENNIKFGKPDATPQEVEEVAKKARCHEFISKLPLGYQTMVGEGGGTLSGGEKQRLSIARALLKNAPIVILDEATASVDPENEFYLQQAISELTKDKTVITIAHRLATIMQADQIIVLDQGKIAQQGKHEQLSSQEGIYKSFLDLRYQAEHWELSS